MKLCCIVFLLACTGISSAQTAGSSTLSSIESLAKQEVENSKKVGDLNRKHMDSYVSEDIKSKRLQEELRDLEQKQISAVDGVDQKIEAKLKEIETGSAWINRRESARRGYKEYSPGTCSAGGPPPICTADHWYSVSVAEAMREYDALVEKELDKIRSEAHKYDKALEEKRREIADFQDGDNEFSELREKIDKQMSELTAENADIRQKIAELSKRYVEQIEAEIQSLQNDNIKGVMNEIAQKHYTVLKIGILEVKIQEIDAEEQKTLQDLEEKIRKQQQQKIDNLTAKINQKVVEIDSRQLTTKSELDQIENDINRYRAEKRDIEMKLQKKDELTEDERNRLTSRENELKGLISSLEQMSNRVESDFKSFKATAEGEIATMKDDSWKLQVGLPTVIQEAQNNVKEAYKVKREIIQDAIEGNKIKQRSIEDAISLKKDEFRNKVKAYENLVEPERIRLMDACRSSGASCWGTDVSSKIWMNANKLLSCASDLEINSVLYTGCEEAFAYYKSVFNSYMNGISDDDLGKLRRNNPGYEYRRILDKF